MTEAGQLIKTTGREQLRFADTCQSFPRSAQKNKFHEFIITKSFNSFKTSLHVRGDKARLFSEGLQEQWSHVSFNDCRKKQNAKYLLFTLFGHFIRYTLHVPGSSQAGSVKVSQTSWSLL